MTSTDCADGLRVMLHALELSILAQMQEFERRSGMSIHAVKVYRSDPINGRRITDTVEVAAELR